MEKPADFLKCGYSLELGPRDAWSCGGWYAGCNWYCHTSRTPGERKEMKTEPRLGQTQPIKLPRDLIELAERVGQLPPEFRSSIEPVMTRVIESTRRRRRILSLVQDSLGQLRLDMKYLMFDLDATRRERDALQKGNDAGDS